MKERRDASLEWTEFRDLDANDRIKILAAKLVSRYIPNLDDKNLSKDTIEKLVDIISQTDKYVQSSRGRTQLKLACASSLLRIACYPVQETNFNEHIFIQLSLCLQDPSFEFRRRFAEKLYKYCTQARQFLPVRYISMFFLAAHDPEKELLMRVKQFVQASLRCWKVALAKKRNETDAIILQSLLAQFIYLLAYHPDFSLEENDIILFERYMEYMLECIADSENISYIFHIFVTIKKTKNANHQDSSDQLYILSDLGQALVRDKCKSTQWALTAPAREIHLPRDLYIPLEDEFASQNMIRNYLPVDSRKSKSTITTLQKEDSGKIETNTMSNKKKRKN